MGLNNFLYQYRTRYVLPDAWEELDLSHPHNSLGLLDPVGHHGQFILPGGPGLRVLPDPWDRRNATSPIQGTSSPTLFTATTIPPRLANDSREDLAAACQRRFEDVIARFVQGVIRHTARLLWH